MLLLAGAEKPSAGDETDGADLHEDTAVDSGDTSNDPGDDTSDPGSPVGSAGCGLDPGYWLSLPAGQDVPHAVVLGYPAPLWRTFDAWGT